MRFSTPHIGLFADYPCGGLSMIHAYSSAPRCVVEHLFNEDWLRSQRAVLVGCFRFPGIV